MNPEIKKMWTDALRSGDYKQGSNNLNNNGKFCCLGVLCDLAEKAGVVEGAIEIQNSKIVSYDNHSMYPPRRVVEWAGLDRPNPMVYSALDGTEKPVAFINDSGRYSFNDIADMIEENL